MATNEKLSISAPWYTFVRRIYMMFGEDEDISIIYDHDENEIKLYVKDAVKADAIDKLFDNVREFGTVSTKVTVIPANEDETLGDIYRRAFAGNPVLKDIVTNDSPYAPDFTYILFRSEPAQYFNDRLDHPTGVETVLYEDIARDLFANHSDGICFGTECSGATIWP